MPRLGKAVGGFFTMSSDDVFFSFLVTSPIWIPLLVMTLKKLLSSKIPNEIQVDEQRGNLRIGYVGATMHSNLPNLLNSFYENYPEIDLNFEEQPNINLNKLDRGPIMDVLSRNTTVRIGKAMPSAFTNARGDCQ